MNLTPIKLMKEGRSELLKFIGEKSAKFDKEDEKLPHSLLAIENASEIARKILQEKGVFEKITEAIASECKCNVPVMFQCKLTNEMKLNRNTHGIELIHLGTVLDKSNAGHYIGAIANHSSRKVYMSDSMGKLGGETNKFINSLKRNYPNYDIVNQSNCIGPQPSGGFCPQTFNAFKRVLRDKKIDVSEINPKLVEQFYEISQLDELSQHHFCYIESFVYMCNKLLGTPMGNMVPRNRIIFIKRVIWGLLQKFNLLNTVSPVIRKYFVRNFKYYMKIITLSGNNIPLKGGLFHIPSNVPVVRRGQPAPKIYKTQLVEISMPVVTPQTSMKRLIELAAVI